MIPLGDDINGQVELGSGSGSGLGHVSLAERGSGRERERRGSVKCECNSANRARVIVKVKMRVPTTLTSPPSTPPHFTPLLPLPLSPPLFLVVCTQSSIDPLCALTCIDPLCVLYAGYLTVIRMHLLPPILLLLRRFGCVLTLALALPLTLTLS